MILPLKITVTKHWLASEKSEDNVRKFRRTTTGDIELPDAQWRTTLCQAAAELGKPLNRDIFTFPERLETETETYERVYNRINKERFEAIVPGTVLNVRIRATDEEATKDELVEVFKLVGELYGLSLWGNKFGYGRFTVEA